MNRIRSLTLAAALLAVGGAGYALAAPSAADAGLRGDCGAGCAEAPRAGQGLRGAHGGRMARLAKAVQDNPAVAVIVNLRAIERVYRSEGRAKELPAFYRAQLERTQDPLVRNFVNYRLARLELRADDAKAALEALTRNLDENYRRL
jgi:hypothetical protein